MKKTACMPAFIIIAVVAVAQQQESLVILKDTVIQVSRPTAQSKNFFPVKSVIVPGTLVLYVFAGLQVEGLKNINREIKEQIRENHSNFSTGIDDYMQYTTAASPFILEAAGIKGKHNLKEKAIIYGMALVIMAGTVYAVKTITHQLRPDGSNCKSFPSGHTANAFMGAEFLKQEYGFRSPWYGYAGYTVASGTGILRMYNNKHWFTDVVTGAGMGILSAKLSYWIFSKIKRNKSTTSGQ
ncbi:MAG: phosphatase PAP2 family protein [Chitinophagaceae bacterium]|nr:phosphatase PAP2 family protein [Chitinophagaceae bacterium]